MPWFSSGSSRSDSLDLVYTIPITKSGWLSGGVGALRYWQGPKKFWVVLRGKVLLLYPASELLNQLRFLEPGRSRRRFSRGDIDDLMTKNKDFIETLARGIETCRVVKFVLPATRIKMQEETCSITLRASKIATLYTSSSLELEKWNALFLNALTTATKNHSDFSVKEEVGYRAFARVYKAQDKETKEKVALKVIEKKSLNKSPIRYRNAQRERRIMEIARGNPFIVDMRYAFQSAERLFLVTEYCPGGDLFECILAMRRAGEPLTEEVARIIAAEIVLALEYLHKLGIIYRDMKPENILLDRNGHIRLADFGLSKVLRRRRDGQLMRTHSCLGTAEYIAPELAWGESYDTSADLWSLGITLYEILTGATPFPSRNLGKAVQQIKHSPIHYNLDVSPSAVDFLRGLLQRDASQRLGGGNEGFAAIKNHAWFVGVDWDVVGASHGTPGPLMDYCRPRVYWEDHDTPYRKVSPHHQKGIDRAMARLTADCRDDRRYVFASLQSEFEEGFEFITQTLSAVSNSDKTLAALSRRPEAPIAKRKNQIVAGYTFTDYPSRKLQIVHHRSGDVLGASR